MRLFSKKTNMSVQQHAHVKTEPALVSIICSYPHRAILNEKTNNIEIPTKVVHVKSTVEPDFKFVSFLAWNMHHGFINSRELW